MDLHHDQHDRDHYYRRFAGDDSEDECAEWGAPLAASAPAVAVDTHCASLLGGDDDAWPTQFADDDLAAAASIRVPASSLPASASPSHAAPPSWLLPAAPPAAPRGKPTTPPSLHFHHHPPPPTHVAATLHAMDAAHDTDFSSWVRDPTHAAAIAAWLAATAPGHALDQTARVIAYITGFSTAGPGPAGGWNYGHVAWLARACVAPDLARECGGECGAQRWVPPPIAPVHGWQVLPSAPRMMRAATGRKRSLSSAESLSSWSPTSLAAPSPPTPTSAAYHAPATRAPSTLARLVTLLTLPSPLLPSHIPAAVAEHDRVPPAAAALLAHLLPSLPCVQVRHAVLDAVTHGWPFARVHALVCAVDAAAGRSVVDMAWKRFRVRVWAGAAGAETNVPVGDEARMVRRPRRKRGEEEGRDEVFGMPPLAKRARPAAAAVVVPPPPAWMVVVPSQPE
ncbi:hypothetical protein H9P43_009351 [Blastocladiella emersonii ATCC 22665]|nr:hypothetical protein H9P43_009351 [Blastocladiella emersonii ATCC 22665]